MAASVRFLVPSSLADAPAERRALEQFLRQGTLAPIEVEVARSYDELATALMSGAAAAAWAPPYACARLEAVALPVALRAMRRGQATYRGAILCRAGQRLSLEDLGGQRAAWVDPESIAGHLLAAALLKRQGLTVHSQYFGSYRAAVSAVLDGRADLTSVYAPPAGAGDRVDLHTFAAPNAPLQVVAFTDETPNDGVVLAPYVSAELRRALTTTLSTAAEKPEGRALLQEVFHVDAFEPAPPGSYRALYVALRQLRFTDTTG